MTWLLDTNACIRYLNGRAPNLKKRIDSSNPADLRICSIVKAEMFYGAARSRNPPLALQQQKSFFAAFISLTFDDAAAESYGRIRSELEIQGSPIGPNDLLIASIALSNGATLVTHNVPEFGRVNGLRVEDWEI